MALSTELREALVRRHRPRLREQLPEQQPGKGPALPGDDPDDNPDPDDCGPRLSVRVAEQNVEKIYTLPALPPPSPDWSHLLCGRPHEAASATSARMALLAVGCRLGIHPSPDALCKATRCHSAGAVRSVLVRVFGERGLRCAYQLAGREQPPKVSDRLQTNPKHFRTSAAPVDCSSAIESGLAQAAIQAPTRLQRWFLAPPRDPPPWRRQETLEERAHRVQLEDRGSWVGE
jgi:hypothetical protein